MRPAPPLRRGRASRAPWTDGGCLCHDHQRAWTRVPVEERADTGTDGDFVRRLSEASPAFARLWARHDIAGPRPCDKLFRYPGVGEIATRTTGLEVTGAPGLRVVVYTPVDEASRERIAWLHAHPDAAVRDHAH
ncbi:hypothetical protein ACQP1W_23020 [Spirillospora sp. CA-255316]